jgi:SAM-dependent methyltransferase
MSSTDYNAKDYERRYQEGYGLIYPESHVIRANKQILEWELGIKGGKIFDFGCGTGAHLRYFAENGFIPYGCDTSPSAIERCKKMMPEYQSHFYVSEVNPSLPKLVPGIQFDVFMTNQVLYFLDDEGIKDVVRQAHSITQAGGVFIATMMAPTCWYSRYITGKKGDFDVVNLDTPRQKGELLINFKKQSDLKDLFAPFVPLHLGSYGSQIRQEEGSTDHWLYVGVKN